MRFARVITPHSLDWVVSTVRVFVMLIGALARGLAATGRRIGRMLSS